MAKKSLAGNCPYCGNASLTDETNQHDERRVFKKCDDSACQKISAMSVVNGVQYPMEDPNDSKSAVFVSIPE